MYLLTALSLRAAHREMPTHYIQAKVWVFQIEEDGTLASISAKPEPRVVPTVAMRGSALRPGCLVCDTSMYLFGAATPGYPLDYGQARRAAQLARLPTFLRAFRGSRWEAAAKAVETFLTGAPRIAPLGVALTPEQVSEVLAYPIKLGKCAKLPDLVKGGVVQGDAAGVWRSSIPDGNGPVVVFPGVSGDRVLIEVKGHEGWLLSPEMQAYIDAETSYHVDAADEAAQAEVVSGQCSICGTYGPYTRITPPSRASVGSAKLCSFNADGWSSFGRQQGHNAQMCGGCAVNVAGGLEDVLLTRTLYLASGLNSVHALWSQDRPELVLGDLWKVIFPLKYHRADEEGYSEWLAEREAAINTIACAGDLHYVSVTRHTLRWAVNRYYRTDGAEVANRIRQWISVIEGTLRANSTSLSWIATLVGFTGEAPYKPKRLPREIANPLEASVYWLMSGEPAARGVLDAALDAYSETDINTHRVRRAWANLVGDMEYLMHPIEKMNYHMGRALALAELYQLWRTKGKVRQTIRGKLGFAMARSPELTHSTLYDQDLVTSRVAAEISTARVLVNGVFPTRPLLGREVSAFWIGYQDARDEHFASKPAAKEDSPAEPAAELV